MYKVALIPGHGSSFDPGAVNKDTGAIESKGNLSVALKLKSLLEYNGFQVKMSRITETACGGAKNVTEDVNNQINFINNSGCDIAVAIHFNSFNKDSHGIEVLYSSLNPGYNQNTIKLGNYILDELIKETGLYNRGLKLTNNGVGVIKHSHIPVVLSESAFVSNDAESIWCTSDEHNMRLAIAHAKGICRYFGVEFKNKEEYIDMALESWQLQLGQTAVDKLASYGLISNPEDWRQESELEKPMPNWLAFELLKRIYEKK